MAEELRISISSKLLKSISTNRNVFGHYHHDQNHDRKTFTKSVLRSHFVEPGVYQGKKTVQVESYTTLCKPVSPTAPASSPDLQELPAIATVPRDTEPKVCWKEFLDQLNANGKKYGFSVPSRYHAVRDQKYSRLPKLKSSFQVPHAVLPTKHPLPPARPHHLKPLDLNKRQKKRKRKKSKKLDLDVSGNSLMRPATDPLPSKDYTPGFVKIKNHDCYRCVNRMSVHDEHTWIQAFNLACRIRKPSHTRASKSENEHLLCITGSLDKSTNEDTRNNVPDQLVSRSHGENRPHESLDSLTKNVKNSEFKPSTKRRGYRIRAGKLERHRKSPKDPKYLTNIMLTTPINVEFIKNLDLNNLSYSLEGAQSLTRAIEYNRKHRQKIMERKMQYKNNQKAEPENNDVAIASSFTMLTQSESLSKIYKEQNEVRELSFSVMEEANTLYRPESISSVVDGQNSNKLPVLVFSETDLREMSPDVQLNKNASANTNVDTYISSRDGKAFKDDFRSEADANSAIDSDASPEEQPETTIQRTSKYENSDCCWVSTSEIVHPNKEILENGVSQLSENPQNQGLLDESEDFPEEDDPFLEEDDDDEEGDFDMESFAIPTGKNFCYTAMTDKRYNKWSRQKRKGGKKKSKKREKEDQSESSNESFTTTQETYLRNLEAMYRSREGTMKYKHEISLSESGPPSNVTDETPSGVSLTSSKSGVPILTGSSTSSMQCVGQDSSVSETQPPPCPSTSYSCEESYSFADDVEDELKMLCTSSNSDQFVSKNEKRDSLHQHTLSYRTSRSRCLGDNLKKQESRPIKRSAGSRRGKSRGSNSDHVPRQTSPLLILAPKQKAAIQAEHSDVKEEHDVELPKLVKSVAAKTKAHPSSVKGRTYIASLQRQILNYHRRNLLNRNSVLCPLCVTLPSMRVRVCKKGQSEEMCSASIKPTRPHDHRKKSPSFIPRNYTVVRNPDEPTLLSGEKGKKSASTTRRGKTKIFTRRMLAPEEKEVITIHGLLSNLDVDDPDSCKTKRRPLNKSPSRGQTFREIYGKSSCPTGNHRNSQFKREQVRSLSSLFISKAVTFSLLPLLDVYKTTERLK